MAPIVSELDQVPILKANTTKYQTPHITPLTLIGALLVHSSFAEKSHPLQCIEGQLGGKLRLAEHLTRFSSKQLLNVKPMHLTSFSSKQLLNVTPMHLTRFSSKQLLNVTPINLTIL